MFLLTLQFTEFCQLKVKFIIPSQKGLDIVLALSVRPKPFPPSVTLFCPDAYLGNGFSDFIVILQEYVLAFEDGSHQVLLHCTNWKQSYDPLFLSNIHSRQIDFLSGLIDLVCPSCLFLSVLPLSVRTAGYELWKVDQRHIASYH